MKSLGEIRRNMVSFYSSIQDKVTDFSLGSVVGGLFFAFSSSLERVYVELSEVRRQAYISTATGEYLDKLIDGTFQLKRSPATRATGYVVVYGNSPLSNPENVELRYADYDHDSGEFIGGVQDSTKFVGYDLQGEDGVVFSLIRPRNIDAVIPEERLIDLGGRKVQFLLLPVASVGKGTNVNVREGGIYSYPSPSPGLSGVLNTNNPGAVFFSSHQAVSSAPFYSRFTEILSYNNSTSSFSVLNAFNFSKTGFVEISGDVSQDNEISALYSNGSITRTAGLIFEYIDANTTNITLSLPIENSLNQVPTLTIVDRALPVTLELVEFTYNSVTYPATGEAIRSFLESRIPHGLIIRQRPDQISSNLIFDPDSVLTSDYILIESARVGGGANEATDSEYRISLRKYLASLSRATDVALEAGTLSIPGVAFARTLPSTLAPRGSAVVLASDESGGLPGGLRGTIRDFLDREWKASGINVIVKQPKLVKINTTMTIKTEVGVFKNAITQQVHATVEEYYKSLLPGASIRYSDLLESIVRIGGVTNVFNLIISKQLTDETYSEYKAKYDELLLSRISTSGVLSIEQPSHGFNLSPGDPAIPVKKIGGLYVQSSIEEASGIVYSILGPDDFEVLEGNAQTLYNVYWDLISNFEEAVTYEYFSSVAISNLSSLGVLENDIFYFVSYALGEAIEEISSENYPINPDHINYAVIRDYESDSVEIFRQNTLTVGTKVVPVVGINYI